MLKRGKKRIGELDFILKDNFNDKTLHVEMAYKFYLLDPNISEPIYRLVGPNRRDMFYTKLDKLKEKQFPLLYHQQLQGLWESLQLDVAKIEQQCCFKGQLFAPFETQINIRPLNTDCIQGYWIHFDAFNTAYFKDKHYYLPKKIEWVVTPHSNARWQTHYQMLLEVNLRMVKEQSPMLWMKNP